MRIVNDQVGVPTTTAAIAEVTDLALSRTQSLEGLYHFAPGEQTSWFGFAAEIVRLMGLRMEVTPIPSNEYPTAARRPAYSVMSVERLKCDLPLNVPSWQELLRCTAARYKPQDIIHL
jgi:dTDP-4-dehydrorhamnose reductase